jgi:arylsulfatase A-like enzyme
MADDSVPEQPNVLFVFSDQHRAVSLGHAGAPNVRTPNFDRLSERGLKADRCISVVPVCTPARASLLTGQYPLTHGLFINDVHLEPTGVSVAEAFAGAGYQTGYIGKWHINGGPWDEPIARADRLGFGFWRGWEC